jgi:branched-chain amino acid transport system ATP-binding protein
MLELKGIHSGYGAIQVLYDISFQAKAGEITCLLGRNGAGKTTTLKTVMGIVETDQGTVSIDGKNISDQPAHMIAKNRIGYVPQGRRLFPELTVSENLEIGLMTCGEGASTRNWVLEIFPRLGERLKQRAGTLSGGEQQMLATARAMCLRPKVMLLDEPTEGLQPSMIAAIHDVILKMKSEGVAIILVEQKVQSIKSLADTAVFIENGRVKEIIDRSGLAANPTKLAHYLGV